MKRSVCFLGLCLIISLSSLVNANACRVTPVNSTQQKNDLAASVLTKMDVSVENVLFVKVEGYTGDYVWTPMCPKGLNSQATFTISFNDVNDPLAKGCTAIVKVYKKWIYEEGDAKYTYEFIQPASCLESL